MVSATDPYGRILGFLDRYHLSLSYEIVIYSLIEYQALLIPTSVFKSSKAANLFEKCLRSEYCQSDCVFSHPETFK
jgi:hypothetical protein